MKFLVTGGAGFIGSHLVNKLIERGDQAVILDDLSTGSEENISSIINNRNVDLVRGSILDDILVRRLVNEADGCFHLGAALGVRRILEKPFDSLTTNLQGSENVIVACAELEKRLFIASTSAIYGKNLTQPLTEESDRVIGSPQLLRWAYSEAKAIDESLAQMFFQSHGLKYVIGRFFNTVGPRQTGMYGMVLPRFIEAAIHNENLEIHGDGSQTRVFCHVLDAVDAVLKLFFNDSAVGKAFNIGGEGEISINELARKVISITGSQSETVYVPYSQAYPEGFEEMMRRVPDTTKLRNLTGWSPKRNLDLTIRDIEEVMRAKN